MSKTMILAIGGAGCNMAETIMRLANSHWVKEAAFCRFRYGTPFKTAQKRI